MTLQTERHIIHVSYPRDDPPVHPGEGWTRFVCVSDTHSRINYSIPPGDVLIHAGDLSSFGSYQYVLKTIQWLRALPHKMKIVIAGNHDITLDRNLGSGQGGYIDQEDIDKTLELMYDDASRNAGIIYLDRTKFDIRLEGGKIWQVYGTPATPFYVPGAFLYDTIDKAREEWSCVPQGVEILITHTPAYGMLDVTRRGKNAGCTELASRLNSLEKCRLHVFGHIHEAHGAAVLTLNNADSSRELISINAAIHDGAQPVLVDLRKLDT